VCGWRASSSTPSEFSSSSAAVGLCLCNLRVGVPRLPCMSASSRSSIACSGAQLDERAERDERAVLENLSAQNNYRAEANNLPHAPHSLGAHPLARGPGKLLPRDRQGDAEHTRPSCTTPPSGARSQRRRGLTDKKSSIIVVNHSPEVKPFYLLHIRPMSGAMSMATMLFRLHPVFSTRNLRWLYGST